MLLVKSTNTRWKSEIALAGTPARRRGASSPRGGFTIVELMIAVIILGVIVGFASPSFRQAVEQSRADIAMANLRAIWTAERLYWLQYRTFTDDWDVLTGDAEAGGLGLLDSTIPTASKHYTYNITTDGDTFTATATRSGTLWSGGFSIDEMGNLGGSITSSYGEISNDSSEQ